MIKPVGTYVMVLPDDHTQVDPVYKKARAAGIELIDGQDQKRERIAISVGTVIKVGPTAWKDLGEAWYKPGDHVAYVRHGGMYVQDPATKVDYLILNPEDICAVVGD